MFSLINMTPSDYWRILLFKDSFNYAGISESNPTKVTSKWDIALHLPEAIQKKFLITVGEFLLKIYKHSMRVKSGAVEEDTGDSNNQAAAHKIQSFMDKVDDFKKEKDHVYISKVISDYFSQKLYSLVSEIA